MILVVFAASRSFERLGKELCQLVKGECELLYHYLKTIERFYHVMFFFVKGENEFLLGTQDQRGS